MKRKEKSKETAGRGDRGDRIDNKDVSQPIQIESSLWDMVKNANDLVNGDGCSLFLREEGTTRFILRDSTVMSPYLGNSKFTVIPKEIPKEKMGATKYVAATGESVRVEDLRYFEYWSNYDLDENELKSKYIGECELPHNEVGSFLAVPLKNDKNEVVGVIRVVRRRKDAHNETHKGEFTEKDEKNLEKYVEENFPNISWAIDISRLLEIGYMLDLRTICTQIVQVLTKMVKAQSCSIFLLDETKNGTKIYRCMGTTGLYLVLIDGGFKEVQDPYYEYRADEIPRHLTTAVIKEGINIIADDLAKFDPKSVFKEINRERGKYRNIFWEKDCLLPTGPTIFIPLFSPCREKDEKPDVLGVITVSRPRGGAAFTPEEFRLCLSLTGRLSRILYTSRFMSLLNQPLTTSDSDKLRESFDSLIAQISEVSGAPGATLFVKDDNELVKKCSCGLLKDEEIEYELPSSPSEYGSPPYVGYTVWVAIFKKPLRFNSVSELEGMTFETKPKHSNIGKCEVKHGGPPKFIAVPVIGTNDEMLGVLRAAKTDADVPFTPSDEALFSSLASRLSPIIENLNTLERLKKTRESELEDIFARKFIGKLKGLINEGSARENFVNKRIQEFFTIDPLDKRDLGTRILDSIRSLWNDTEVLVTKDKAPIESFKFFNEQILAELPGYRDHFIHQYQVFLLGYYIIEKLNMLGVPFHKSYFQSLASCVDEKELETEESQEKEEIVEKNQNIEEKEEHPKTDDNGKRLKEPIEIDESEKKQKEDEEKKKIAYEAWIITSNCSTILRGGGPPVKTGGLNRHPNI